MILKVKLSVASLNLTRVFDLSSCHLLLARVPALDVKHLADDDDLGQTQRAQREAVAQLVR